MIDRPTGGLTISLDKVAESLCQTWIAWGSGDADFDETVVDDNGIVRADRIDKDYTLRRVELTEEQVQGYYYGYSNQALWPLYHHELEHVNFDRADWETYRRVNRKFADKVSSTGCSNVWIHDYHLTLLPRYIRDRSDSARTLVHFWHIPWPPLEVFKICPQRESIIRGLLANDAIGFHIERFRQRFLECVEALLDGTRSDRESGVVWFDGEQTNTYVVPTGVDIDAIDRTLEDRSRDSDLRPAIGELVQSGTLAIGVDRLDYTKGILERLEALEQALSTTPELFGDLVYLQIASKSREQIPSYRRYHRQVLEKVDKINQTYGTGDWRPVVYTDERLPREAVLHLLKRAEVCIVSSRRDGLNLVAEEFVAASRNNPGELLLSEFTGAAEILDPASTTVNPFDTSGFADKIVESTRKSEDAYREQIDELLEALEGASLDNWVEHQVKLFEE